MHRAEITAHLLRFPSFFSEVVQYSGGFVVPFCKFGSEPKPPKRPFDRDGAAMALLHHRFFAVPFCTHSRVYIAQFLYSICGVEPKLVAAVRNVVIWAIIRSAMPDGEG